MTSARVLCLQSGMVALARTSPWPGCNPHLYLSMSALAGVYDELVKICCAEPGIKEQRVTALAAHLDRSGVIGSDPRERQVEGRNRRSDLGWCPFSAYGGQHDMRQALERATNTIARLGFVAGLLWEKGSEGLDNVKPHVGLPVKPESQTWRKPTELTDIWNEFGTCYVHTKHDGVRCQIHKEGKERAPFCGA